MIPYMDAHCDTLTVCADQNQSLGLNQGCLDINRLWESGCALQTFAVWLNPKLYPQALQKTLLYLEYFWQEQRACQDWLSPVLRRSDLQKNLREGKVSALLTLEGGEALEGQLPLLHTFFRLGVRGMNLVWNHANALGFPATGTEERGLTDFGKEVVMEMELLHMIPDASHLNEAGFWDLVLLCQKPFMASHSNAQSLCRHPRNLTDDQIRALVEKGCFVGLNLCPFFLTDSGEAGMEDVLRHAEHILRLGGEEILGLGTDFDGITATPAGLPDVTAIPVLIEHLAQAFGQEVAEKIAYRNFLGFLDRVLPDYD